MSRITTIKEAKVATEAEDDATLPLPQDDEVEPSWMQLTSDFENDEEVMFWVYRINAARGNSVFLYRCLPAEFVPEHLGSKFKGGTFRVWVKRGSTLLKTFTIKAEAIETVEEHQTVAAKPAMANELAAAITALQNTVAQLAQSQRPAETEEAMLNRIRMYRDIFGGAQPAAQANPAASFELFQKGIEFAKNVMQEGAEKSTNDVLVEAVRTLGPAFAEIVARGARAQPAAQPVSAAITQTNNNADNLNVIEKLLKPKINWLCDMAAGGADPGLYADLIMDQVPETQLRDFVTSGDPFKKLVAIHPRAAEYGAWFGDLLSHINAVMTDTTGDANANDNAPG